MKPQSSTAQAITAPLEPLFPLCGDMAIKTKGGVNKHLKNGTVVFYPTIPVVSAHSHFILELS
jgi:hypothetical protein